MERLEESGWKDQVGLHDKGGISINEAPQSRPHLTALVTLLLDELLLQLKIQLNDLNCVYDLEY